MRLGGPVFGRSDDPGDWIAALRARGYRAANCPVGRDVSASVMAAYAAAAAKADIVIAEVGAWSNPLSQDDDERRAALVKCQEQLALADEIGARCCVNITGSRGTRWDGPDPLNFTAETFDMIVETTRAIIDAVKPSRTYYTLETMPWMYPDSADSYLALLKAIDRPQCAAHLDPVNLICSPRRYFENGAVIRECFQKLGPHIKSCHAKDVVLRDVLTTHLDEVCPGQGGLDYDTYLAELSRLDADTPLMLEHMHDQEDYAAGAAHIRAVAARIGTGV
jgi:sugar phosphate isomerase/epimerase